MVIPIHAARALKDSIHTRFVTVQNNQRLAGLSIQNRQNSYLPDLTFMHLTKDESS